jgi:hypothetical protein
MTDRSKFEQMLEHLINDNEAKARELFHDIVVAKSREIYENLLADDFEEETEEGMEMGMEPEEAMGGDETDDMLGDVESDDDMGGDEFGGDDMGGDEFGGDDMGMGGEEELGDRLDDLEAELEALKDEFESLMGNEEGEEGEFGGDDMGGDDMGGDEFGGEEEEEGEEEGMYFEKQEDDEDDVEDEKTDEDFIREYVEKVGGGKDYTSFGKMGDDGVNTKSIVAGKNDMGGTAKNLNQAGTEKSPVEANKGELRGTGVFKGSKPQLQDGGNINKPGGNAGKTAFKKKEPGHGAEKKGTGDNGANTNSPINGAPGRAK